ncbi:anhydro-N-acetylmuramic acid kinase [Parapedobacter pyrenivorans]|uniref:Anhydro-N-acetylmuramic acid kinase n=1 Tax=Parapedobacter pyrenivorans TaxID=1305674 RepID=A0A917I1T1_9SPHI|nr:anhydro-N-acetylmuramic acid kinase [Parapedobacter pyrenivorans]GGH00795.1 anhydro-N-acetylmuramic acid kinase [Parapedobacter pyrenivorans]
MNEYVEKLYTIARQDHRLIVGLMSGTSLDGLDIALCRLAGSGRNTVLEMLRFETRAYSHTFRNKIRSVFSKRTIDQQLLCGLHALIGQVHGTLVNETLVQWGVSNAEIDLIASHGQTVFHAPQSLTGNYDYPNSTLQIGDGDHLAVATGIITISDFRQKHIAAGGEGAPLAAYGDYLLFASEQETRVLLNIGGIANFTFLPAIDSGRPCFATDVGPGNTLMDQYMQAKLGMEMDRDARVAATGTISEVLLRALLNHDFFALPFPKTTGPELFNLQYLADAQQATGTEGLAENDVMATLSAFSASAIVASIQRATGQYENLQVYVSGGGLHNPLLLDRIRDGLAGVRVSSFDELGLLPDAKEAALFALLANETVAGKAADASAVMNAPAVCMGKISFPK